MHAISNYRGNRHRPPARHKHRHRQDRLQYTASLASAQYNDGATGRRKQFDDIFNPVDTMHQRDRWTDRYRRTPGDSKDRAYA